MRKKSDRTNIYHVVVFAILLGAYGILHAAPTYTNPVISEIGPADPTILLYDGVYYMYPTGDNTSYHVYTSYDLVHWSKGPKVFVPGGINIWAPDVFYHPADGKFYLYYTADLKIGVAVADSPVGPFVDQGILLDGFIDAHLFQDADGKYYLYFTDIGHIYVQQMSSPLTLTGSRQVILQPSQSWEMQWGSVNEGPWMIKHNGLYYLLYSGSGADSQYYAVGYATAASPLGPFTKYSGNPIVHSGSGVYGPGHGAVTTDAAGNLWHIYHQKTGTEVDWNRFICLDPMWFDEAGILHGTATRGVPRPAPVKAADAGVMAWWRFEAGPADTDVIHTGPAAGVYSPDIEDISGRGNDLSVWQTGGNAGYGYRTDVAYAAVPLTGAANTLSVKNTGTSPSMWCPVEQLQTMTPPAFTVETTFKIEQGGWKTIVGRDSYGTATQGNDTNPQLAALYLQATDNPSRGLAIKFCDVDGYWHDAVSGPDAYVGFDYQTDPDGLLAPWYTMAAVSDGTWLRLYLYNHDTPEAGYQLIAVNDMVNDNPGSTNTSLTAGAGDGSNWDAGDWTVGRGLYNGGHADRAYGFIDEVRISQVALDMSDFLLSESTDNKTVAWWRFEEGPADAQVTHGGLANGQFYPGALDSSGNGNDLSAWSEGLGAYTYRAEVASTPVTRTGADNNLSVQNSDSVPGMFTSSADANPLGVNIDTWQPQVFTIEASFKPQSGDHRTIVGRDGINVTSAGANLAALYFQIQPDDSVAIKFADVSGYWHQAVSPAGIIQYDGSGHWYHMAAVCDGSRLSLYLNDVDAQLGYQLLAQTDMTASGSPDTRLVADTSSGSDWHGGGWSVGRGLFGGGHTDRLLGYIDEVRISGVALDPGEFLFYKPWYAGIEIMPSDLLIPEDGSAAGDLYFTLDNLPAGDVILTIQEQDGRGQLILDRTELTFTTGNWNVPQSIHLTAVEDADLENAEHEVLLSVTVFSAEDPEYDGLQVDPVIVKIADNECGAWGYAAGDFNMDCGVDLDDFAAFAAGWLDCSDPDLANCTNYIE